LDRDGTLNELVPDLPGGDPESPVRVEDVKLIPGAAEAARSLAEAGWMLIGASNQPAAAKGTVSLERLMAVQDRVLSMFAELGVQFDDFRLCLHHPEAVVPGLGGPCDCRKPKPGLLLDAAAANEVDLAASWMIGDTDADILAGQAAGCQTVLIEHPGSAHKRSLSITPTLVMPDFAAAAASLSRGAR
jgi:D-glycero-D-manno-heptose 1,7-bisphosphate phosphatase